MLKLRDQVTTSAIRKFRRRLATSAKKKIDPSSPILANEQPKTENQTPPKPPSPPKPPAARLIFGLGNPGDQFKSTRHNIGFLCLDTLAQSLNLEFNKSKFDSDYAEFMYKGAPVYLIKPKTFMNLSGSSVRRWVDSTKAPLFNCLVVVDAAELPLGELRIRPKGSSAGQNGIKNIIDTLKSDEFARLRVGIGRPKSRDIDLRDYVLGKWSAEEHWTVQDTRKFATFAAKSWLEEGADKAGTKFNKSYEDLKKWLESEASQKSR